MNDSRKRWVPLALILVAGVCAIVYTQRRHIAARPSPQALLSAAADAQHEVTRVPAHIDPLSDADEIAIGDRLAAQYSGTFGTKPPTAEQAAANRQIEAYLQRIGERAATHARRKLPWHFHYIANPEFVNAFALPGGHVFVGEGLLKLMRSEDALAGVLGHEVEHIDLRHCAERVQIEAHERHLSEGAGLFGSLLGLPVEIFIAGYSKEQELEADRDGTTLAVLAGYSPQGILQLFAEFAKLEARYEGPRSAADPIGETLGLSLATLSGYFASHPPAAERIQQVNALIAANHWPSPPLRPLQMSF